MGNVCFGARREKAVVCSDCKKVADKEATPEERGAWHMDGDEAVCGNCASQRDQQKELPSEAGSGRSTASDTFSTSHVIPADVEARAGPKLGRITPFPLDRTVPPPARSLAEGRKSQSPALTAFSED